jgi:hypothetical protein
MGNVKQNRHHLKRESTPIIQPKSGENRRQFRLRGKFQSKVESNLKKPIETVLFQVENKADNFGLLR